MLYNRNIKTIIEEALLDTPVVVINGARQVGKSTIVEQLTKEFSQFKYITFDDATALAAASSDSYAFLEGLGPHVAIDEAQRVPEIFLAIKRIVDKKRSPGSYILTGSANVLTIPKVSESLAGRMEVYTLWPFSQGELLFRKEIFIETVFSENLKTNVSVISWEQLCNIIIAGGYPAVLKRKLEYRREQWFESYLLSVLQRDIRELSNTEGLIEIPNILGILANRAGNLLNFSDLSRTGKIPATTLKRYFALLQTVFMIYLIPFWATNQEKKIIKSPKIYLSDTGLLCFLKKLNLKTICSHKNYAGALLENFVVTELMKQISWCRFRCSVYHFRTFEGREVDVVLEANDKRIVGIEIKAASFVTKSDFNGLHTLKEFAGEKFHKGIILYAGEQIIPFEKNFYAIPISALWEW